MYRTSSENQLVFTANGGSALPLMYYNSGIQVTKMVKQTKWFVSRSFIFSFLYRSIIKLLSKAWLPC